MDFDMLSLSRIPRNVEFLQVDIETPWQSMGRDTWDVIHMRTLIGSIQDWGQLYSQIFAWVSFFLLFLARHASRANS